MPGPLEVTFPQLSNDPYEVDENITMLVHWNPGNFTIYEPRHEISNNVVCVTSKASDQPAHTRRLIRAFASRLIFYDC